MSNIIKHKRSNTSGLVPSTGSIDQAELAINIFDGKLYTKNSSNSVINLGVSSISGTSITPNSGNFTNSLQVNGTEVSVSGHSHTSSDIGNFGIAVSGLLPAISNSGDNKILTSTGSTVGVNAESNLTFDGSSLIVSAGGTTSNNGQLYLNGGTSNRIEFNTNGVSDSSLFTRPNGQKIRLYPSRSTATADDFSIGIGGDGLGGGGTPTRFWQTINSTSSRFQWYAAATNIATLTGSGIFSTTRGLFSEDVTASGSFIGGSGTALLPSFEFINDPDTGLFSPAADTFGISTSGIERLRVDSVGNVGIGTTSPTSKLQVNGLITANSGINTNNISSDYNLSLDAGGGSLSITNADDMELICYAEIRHSYGSDEGSFFIKNGLTNKNQLILSSGSIVLNDNITSSGNILISNQTASTIASFDSNKNIVSLSTGTYPSLIELGYVKGVTSAIQTQLNSKQATLTNPVTGTGIANHIAYWSSTSGIAANSGQLYWDSTNNRLGIAIENPQYSLQVVGTGTVQNLRVDPIISSGTLVSYTHPDYTELTNTDIIISGQLELTRANANGIYNLAVESVWNGTGPLNTTWNAEGWSNLNSYKTRTYIDLYSAVNGNLGNNLPGAELIMRHVPTDRYWKIQFSSWTQGGAGGGFSYTRQELFSSGGTSILNGTIELNGPINKINTSQLFANGADLAGGGQLPDIVLKGYAWFGKVDGSVGIAAHHSNSGTFSSTSSFYQFGGFNESVTAYTPICFTAGNNAQLFLHTNLNVGIGTTNPSTKLHVNGIISQSPVHASAGLSTDQTIPSGVDTVLQLTDKNDPNNWWNTSTYRFLPTVSGHYFISAQANWDPGAGNGQLNIQIRRNGTTAAICQNAMITGVSFTQSTNAIVNLNGSSDYIDLTAYTSTTNASQVINGTADRAWTKLEAYKIS